MSESDFSNAVMRQLQRASLPDDLPQRLQAWFATRVPAARDLQLVSLRRTSAAAGMSAEIFLVDLRWSDAAGAREATYVLRAELSGSTNACSDMNAMVSVLKLLGDHTDLAVPKLYWSEYDRSVIGGPFCVMQFLDGVVAPDSPPFTSQGWVFDATPEQRRRMYHSGIAFLARLHRVDWQALGMNFLQRNHGEQSHTGWLLERSIAIFDDAVDGKRGEYEDTAIRWLREHLPAREHLRISWSDSRPGNMLWRDFELSGALDWEMCTLMNPAYDVSLWLYADYNFAEGAGIKRLPGMLERDEFIAAYERAAGKPLHDYPWFEVYSAFRSHAIVASMMATWERNGQHLYGEHVTVHDCPTLRSFRHIASRHV